MQYRIENDKLIPAPPNFRTPAGEWIINFNLSPELMTLYGFTLTEADAEEWRKLHPAPKPAQTVFSKLAIRRAMRSLGIEGKLNALLDASDTFRADWTDAQEIDLADPVLTAALATGGITDEEIAQIKSLITSPEANNPA